MLRVLLVLFIVFVFCVFCLCFFLFFLLRCFFVLLLCFGLSYGGFVVGLWCIVEVLFAPLSLYIQLFVRYVSLASIL